MIEAIYKYTCCKCGKEVEQKISIFEFFPPPVPLIPHNWHRIDNDCICDEHVFGIMDKVTDVKS